DYTVIRAIDNSITAKEIFKFVSNRANFINLNPIFIVCVLEKNTDIITSFKYKTTFL
ncbi:MAG: hypothetical protein RLZZ292_3185, partial [Bacteroidota bacterium]